MSSSNSGADARSVSMVSVLISFCTIIGTLSCTASSSRQNEDIGPILDSDMSDADHYDGGSDFDVPDTDYYDGGSDANVPDADQGWEGLCPQGMNGTILSEPIVTVYCIDSWEAFIDDDGRAVPRNNILPSTPVSWTQARESCRRAGKDLCQPDIWRDGCSGGSHPMNYPYGDTYEDGRCNDEEAEIATVWLTGSSRECCDPLEMLCDFVGNVFEWVDYCDSEDPTQCMYCGGAYYDNRDGASCTACRLANRDDATIVGSGFRCCIPTRE
jgi:hypothetical protein